jgi:hypothetical protein
MVSAQRDEENIIFSAPFTLDKMIYLGLEKHHLCYTKWLKI